MKNYCLTVLLLLCSTLAWGQGSLEITELEQGVFSNEGSKAAVAIFCPLDVTLTFESTHDKVVDVFNQVQKGEENVYYLRFDTGKRYQGRRLTIMPSGYQTNVITLDLTAKQLRQFRMVSLENTSQYWKYRRQGMEYFEKGLYNEAKDYYDLAESSSDRPSDANISDLIANVDSVLVYQQRATQAMELLDYSTASQYYGKIAELNPNDENAVNNRAEAERLNYNNCLRVFSQAEQYYEDGEYDRALELYRRVVTLNCRNASNAQDRVTQLERRASMKKQHARVFVIEFPLASTMMVDKEPARKASFNIGLSYGKYKSRKAGGYFTVNANTSLIDAAQGQVDKNNNFKPFVDKVLEANMAAGWTINPLSKVQQYVWLFFTPFGYTGAGYYKQETVKEGEIATASTEKRSRSFNWGNAWSPEIGLLAKVGPVALRYTFQYRMGIGNDNQKLPFEVRTSRHVLGIGFCW